jgi:trehalose-phosphatase
MSFDSALEQAVATLAYAPRLLVASDYDGTLAPIVAHADQAFPTPGAIDALQAVAALPETSVAVVSGRALAALDALAEFPPNVHRVGSHGVEFDGPVDLDPERAANKARLLADLHRIAANLPGAVVEEKPAGAAFHYRNADAEQAGEAVQRVLEGPAQAEGIFVRDGKKVMELAVVDGSKGAALRRLRMQLDATHVLFVGDDVTDEEGFASLEANDLGVKVGPEPTRARCRVEGPAEVVRLFEHLADLRRRAQS